MQLKGKHLVFATMPAIILLLAGCGGMSASPSVSPASFFLPGLLKAEPRQPVADPAQAVPEPVTQVALAQ
jgi:hypothetical protein